MHVVTMDAVIPHYGELAQLLNILDCFQLADKPVGFEKIIVVENGQEANASNVGSLYPNLNIVYTYTETAGLTNARNIGVRSSQADFIVLLDNDLSFGEFFLRQYYEAFCKRGQMYFFGGQIEPVFESNPHEWLLDYCPTSVKGLFFDEDSETSKAEFLGGNHAISRKAIELLTNKNGQVYDGESATADSGGIGEETRLQNYLLANGFKGWKVSEATVLHPVPKESLTYAWVCNRRYRAGVTAGSTELLTHKSIPVWLFKIFYSNYIKEQVFLSFSQRLALKYGVSRAWAKGAIDAIKNRTPS
ncbi:glycosyltransferase family 2 protein [Alteromonas sp. ALT199]|uniref:glycosyltransferase n=1 Tax=unclassified Alteromonas TaxID=2614992 RepID=UPI001BE865B2|nr:glycosyltransferase [Alteromonas sp. ALT199]MBT3136278.1 glycosyltransferase family 2 protein [Alteromonas sp. ALT199]